MMSNIPKIIAIWLSLMVIIKTYYDFKKKQDSIFMLIFWSATWLIIAAVSLWTDWFVQLKFDLEKQHVGLGTLFGIAFVFLFFVVYRVYTKANRLEKKLRDIVIKLGLKDIK